MVENLELSFKGDTPSQISLQIEDKGIKYNLDIENKKETITFSIIDKVQLPYIKYNYSMSFNEIKSLNKTFSKFYSIEDFFDHMKSLNNNKQLNISKYNNKISLFISSYNDNIQIDLFPVKNNTEINIKEICNELLIMKEKLKEIDILKSEINFLKSNSENEIKSLKEENKKLNNEISLLKNKIKEQSQDINKLKETDNKHLEKIRNNKLILTKISDDITNKENAEIIYDELNLRNLNIEKNKVLSIIKQNNFDKDKIKNIISEQIYDKLYTLNDVDFTIDEKDKILKTIILLNFNEEEIKKIYKRIGNKYDNYDLDELEMQMYDELKDEYGIMEEEKKKRLQKAIKELKCDRQNIKEWIENVLIDI